MLSFAIPELPDAPKLWPQWLHCSLAGVAALLVYCSPGFAQPPQRPMKRLTAEQKEYQSAISQWSARHKELRAQAVNALNAERARDKAGDCPNADTTLAQEQCLASEIQKTQANYAIFAQGIRAMLGQVYPTMPGPASQPISGPAGPPPTSDEQVKKFDKLEAESKAYRADASSAAYDEFRGGTLAPVFSLEAEQKLLRLHMEEMAFIYGEELSNH